MTSHDDPIITMHEAMTQHALIIAAAILCATGMPAHRAVAEAKILEIELRHQAQEAADDRPF
jgi:hypothetical protein